MPLTRLSEPPPCWGGLSLSRPWCWASRKGWRYEECVVLATHVRILIFCLSFDSHQEVYMKLFWLLIAYFIFCLCLFSCCYFGSSCSRSFYW